MPQTLSCHVGKVAKGTTGKKKSDTEAKVAETEAR